MSGAIYFKTRYGSTKDYAVWLAEKTGFGFHDIKDGPKVGPEDIIILGSNLLMGKMPTSMSIGM